MDIVLTPIEARVLGVLMEKEKTTPDYYPLTLNSVVLACNQKSNRNPVMELDENSVLLALNSLTRKHLVIQKNIEGSRVLKYGHDINCLFELTAQEFATICILLLRGYQTPGEINGRTSRMCTFKGIAEVEEVLNRLISREDGPFVSVFARKPGLRERRYKHMLCAEEEEEEEEEGLCSSDSQNIELAQNSAKSDRVDELGNKVDKLQSEVNELKEQFAEFKKQFE